MSSEIAKETAKKVAKIMWANDDASKSLGMEILSVDSGHAKLGLRVEKRHCNGLGTCHGGITFALADSAFAFACNSYNRFNVAQQCSIAYIRPGKEGDYLIAVADEISKVGRGGIYDIRVYALNDADDALDKERVIAEFRGNSREIKGQHFEE
ncbi:MAG: hydroxyphenylacetyl-CoA thioesterase PaaI [Alphaproteobacteria bacterium]|nr:hydroxyphenylacetyl-CoA thioesterase PaaI [Alphaproteobacteria bacterium]